MTRHRELVLQGEAILEEAPQAYLDLDVEADGVPGFGSLLSVGAISPWGETFYAELQPSSDRFLPGNRKFCEDHNLERERLLDEGQNPRTVMHELAAWAIDLTESHDKDTPVLAAFNASFDFPWVDLAMKEAGIMKNPFGVAGFCIKSLAMALPGPYNWRKTTKGRLPAELVPEGDFTHNALEDAVYQQKIHFALAARLNEINS